MIPAPLASHTIALLLGANLSALLVIAVTLVVVRRRIRDLTAMHHDAIVRLLEIRGVRPVGVVAQQQIEGQASRSAA